MPVPCASCRFVNPEGASFCGRCSAPLNPKKSAEESPTQTIDFRTQGLKTGSVVAGRYEIVERLGEGGMGQVYKAHDLEVREDIALKLIRPEIAANPRIIQRFQNELKLTRKISHRNVCRMFDLGREGSALFITMEFVPGEDLKTTIRRIGPMNVRKTLAIGKQICQGLSEAHGQGVIHRDLKPGNIIIDRNGDVRILDFGIALSRETAGGTDPGLVPGTLHYVAPELFGGAKPSASSDIYSLGVILYEMVTGRLPLEDDRALGTAVRGPTGAIKEPTAFDHGIPPALSRLILKCLDRNPAKRFPKAEDVCAELSRIEEELPAPEAGPLWIRLWAAIRSRPGPKWATAVGLPIILIAGVLLIGRGGAPPPRSSARAKPGPSDSNAILFYSYGLAAQDEYFKTERAADFQACLGFFRKALDIEPGSAIIHWQLGAVYEAKFNRDKKENDEKQMIEHWERAYALDRDLAQANLGVGWIHFNREEHDLAFGFFKRAMELDGGSAEVNVHVGSFLRSLGLYGQARKHYARALELRPVPGDFAEWHRLLADCDSQLGDVRQAADRLRMAMELKSDFRITLDLAVCLLKLNDFAEAEKQIAEAERQGADAGRIRLHKALWYAVKGEPGKALGLLENEANLSNPLVTGAYAMLGKNATALRGIRAVSGSRGFQRARWYPYSYLVLEKNPFFDRLRDDPEFRAIREEERLRYDERVRKFREL